MHCMSWTSVGSSRQARGMSLSGQSSRVLGWLGENRGPFRRACAKFVREFAVELVDGVSRNYREKQRQASRMKRVALPFDLGRHVLNHLVGQLFRDVLEVWLNEHIAA